MKKPLLILSATLFAFASEARVLTWAESVELAQKNNADLSAAQADLQSAQSRFQSEKSAWFPSVSAGLNYDKSNRGISPTTGLTSSGYSASVSASQNLFAGFSDESKIEQARSSTRGYQAALDAAKAKLSYDLKVGFEGYVNAHEAVGLTAEILKRREENLRLVELRFDSGLENKGSVLLSQAYLSQAEYENLQAQNNERVARLALLKALGLDDSEDFTISGMMPINDPGKTPENFDQLVDLTPDQIKAVADEESARWGLTAAHSNFYPTLGLTGSLSRAGPEFFPDARKNWAWGIGLTVPLFSGGRDYYASQAAAATWQASTSRKTSSHRALREKLENSYMSFSEAVAKLKVDESFQLAALTRAEIARRKYNNGLLTFEDWDVIENDLISRQKTVLVSRRDRVVSEADWEQSRGVGAIK